MRLGTTLGKLKTALIQTRPDPGPAQPPANPTILFFSACNGVERAYVHTARGTDLETAWLQGSRHLERWLAQQKLPPRWLRVDVVDQITATTWGALKQRLRKSRKGH